MDFKNSKHNMNPPHSKTTIGRSPNSRPNGKDKAKKRNFKKNRGQGRGK